MGGGGAGISSKTKVELKKVIKVKAVSWVRNVWHFPQINLMPKRSI